MLYVFKNNDKNIYLDSGKFMKTPGIKVLILIKIFMIICD